MASPFLSVHLFRLVNYTADFDYDCNSNYMNLLFNFIWIFKYELSHKTTTNTF
jgi:hypothetical protein